jgi:glycine/D-amino acid oxidase-like deaminating enzyme
MTRADGATTTETFDAVVVGAGMSGLYALKVLREQGLRVVVLERGSGVGGSWFWNRYPGARCDIPSLEYSFGFDPELEQEWEWSEHFASQPEIERYLNHIADRYDLRPDIRLETGVQARLLGDLAAAFVAGLTRLTDQVVERVAFGVEHVAEVLRDLVVHPAEVVVLEPLLALLAQPLEHLAQALHPLAVAVLEAGLQHAPQRRVDVTVVEQVVGELTEDVVSSELEALLRAVPPGVQRAVGLGRTWAATAQDPHGRRLPGALPDRQGACAAAGRRGRSSPRGRRAATHRPAGTAPWRRARALVRRRRRSSPR